VDPITGEPGVWHGGVDLVSEDRNVRAVRAGTVLRSRMAPNNGDSDRTWEWGNYVTIAGSEGRQVSYAHLAERLVEVGQYVSEGQIIGIEGNTGRSTGRHLHLEVRDWNGLQEDPCAYIGIENIAGYVWKPKEPWVEQASTWAQEAADWAVRKGIIQGKGGGDYGWQDSLTREELAVILYRAREVL
jgi:murein DD-endopeptidase MepM/ murein hydrolase activator NlpD